MVGYTKMDEEQQRKERQINKFTKLYEYTQGGIFQKKTRGRILTKEGLTESSPAKNVFWYRHRENVKTALIDLQLFLEEAGENHVKQVMTEESLFPLMESLFSTPFLAHPELRKAKIARLFIQAGFKYFEKIYYGNITMSHANTMAEANNLADYLAEPMKKRAEPIKYKFLEHEKESNKNG